MTTPLDALARDRELLWHPYTSMTDPAPVRLVTGAEGVRLRLHDAERGSDRWVIDGMSSWWAAIHGYRHPHLDAALAAQAADFSHVMFGGLTHAPAIGLAERLVALTGMDHVFLADSGSVSVEVALKMALQFQRGRGRPERTRLLTVAGGYHGDTLGCMSVTDPVGGMHSMFAHVVPGQLFGPRPPAAAGVGVWAGAGPENGAVAEAAKQAEVAAWCAAMDELAADPEVAAIIVEPLLQGAGGMWVYPTECLRHLRALADRHGLLLIADEIATGFGRTGELFASLGAGVRPDILCVGKALTGGYLTLAAALCTADVAAGVGASESGVLMHGPTYMGNPLACAVASASLDLLEAADWASQVGAIGGGLRDGLAVCRGIDGVLDVRTIGAVGVVQLDRPVNVAAATQAALEAGVWLRPFRDLIYT
ncbi:MAG: adenosylmethionine--8-amino-7-oxononanoate transaminase, partial [Nocardioides sp.]